MEVKKDILWRVYLVYAFLCLFGIAIMVQIFRLQFVQGSYWKSKADSLTTSYRNIEAIRGNIYASDGSLLATSLPVYELRMDMVAGSITDEIFSRNVDSLTFCLSQLFKDKKPRDYRRELVQARMAGERYHFLQRNVSYSQLKQIRKWPIFRLGKYKGGLIAIQRSVRERPFKFLAARTIGYNMAGKSVGLEGSFEQYLQGTSGKRLMQRISGNVWVPINDDNEIEPKDGNDVVTTLDINIQDVAESALLTQLTTHNAHHGCAVLMEVSTGNIKAIANLSRNAVGEYSEQYNYAIGESMEPGSTFKLASLIAAMEDGLVKPQDSVDLENGSIRYYNQVMKDSHAPEKRKVTIQRAFEISSNVGISRVINKNYIKNPQVFIDRLYKMNLAQPLGLQLNGEADPVIKNTKAKDWSGTSLPWMSIGYELRLTPLQILTFYNAVANNGIMVKPQFVKEVRRRGEVIQEFAPKVMSDSICSYATIVKAKHLLEGVVENGTATNLKNPDYRIAGKTGTAQIARGRGYRDSSGVVYQASFVGYFPAENPKYSCIVVVNAPSNDVYYAAQVAGPIFKEIADKVYSTSLEMHKELSVPVGSPLENIPSSATASYNDLKNIYSTLSFAPVIPDESAEWGFPMVVKGKLNLQPKTLADNVVPDLTGMGLKDAVYLLENNGVHVKTSGHGYVRKQSLPAGTRIIGGTEISLQLM